MPLTQEQFDTVLFGIRKQGGPSVQVVRSGDAFCRYRTEDGRRCAIGWLIPDDKYTVELEGQSLKDALEGTFEAVLPNGIDFEDLMKLQAIHDTAAVQIGRGATHLRRDFFPEWEGAMEEFATARGITYTAPEAVS